MSRYSTAILRYPSGRYGIAGSVPAQFASTAWATEDEVKTALLETGCPFFQNADCTWTPRRPTTEADRAALNAYYGS